MKRNLLWMFITVGIVLNFTACSGLKKSFGSSEFNKSYQERLSAFHNKNAGKTLILKGEKYYYSFPNALKVTELLKAQKLLNLNPSNLSLNLSVKEYKSSIITLRLFSHFEKSKLSKEQIAWFESHHVPLEVRANFGGKKSEPKSKQVPTYVELIVLQGERKALKNNENFKSITPIITLEVSEHISR